MNKIIIDKEEVILEKITKKINVEVIPRKDIFGITKIIIDVIKSTDLEINSLFSNTKLDIVINLKDNVILNLYEYKRGEKAKLQYTYNLDEESNINVFKFSNLDTIKEMIICNLNGNKSSISYNFKAISTCKEVYDMIINHNHKNTSSDIKNNSVCTDDGKVSFQVSSYVDKGIKNCHVNQTNRIINLNNNKCEIRPNLYIDEYDVDANHSALIGGFNGDELFYLQSRGIREDDANKLLIKGFLLSDLSNKKMIKDIENNIKEYWG